MKITIGVDPDAKAHGIAEYRDGKLVMLTTANNVDLVLYLRELSGSIVLGIEDVKSQGFVYGRNVQASKAAQSKVARNIGQCQQAQIELMNWLDRLGIKYKLYKPTKYNWAKDKERFERFTGWAKRSNEDTRSAAYFGFLAAGGFRS